MKKQKGNFKYVFRLYNKTKGWHSFICEDMYFFTYKSLCNENEKVFLGKLCLLKDKENLINDEKDLIYILRSHKKGEC